MVSCPAHRSIREQLQRYPWSKLGFIVYKCIYASDDHWTRFMAYLDISVMKRLDQDGLSHVILRFDSNIQDDPASLDGANLLSDY
jgi:hypothetical protein